MCMFIVLSNFNSVDLFFSSCFCVAFFGHLYSKPKMTFVFNAGKVCRRTVNQMQGQLFLGCMSLL